jgi:hypothetical protein
LVDIDDPAGSGFHLRGLVSVFHLAQFKGYQRYTTAFIPPVHLIQGFEPSPLQCMRKFAVFLESQLAPGTVRQSTAPGADTARGAVLALP